MTLTTKQFNELVSLVVEKILYTPGIEDCIRDYSGDFALKYHGKVGVYYKCGESMLVDLPWLANNGDTLPSFERCRFIEHLLTSLKDLIEKNKSQRDDFEIYLEQIKSL